MDNTWGLILPDMLMAAGGLLVLLFGAFWHRRPAGLLFSAALVSVGLALAAVVFFPANPTLSAGPVSGQGFARFFAATVMCVALIALLFSFGYARNRGFNHDVYYAMLLFAALGMDLVSRAGTWLIFFLGLELMSIALYVLVAVRKDNPLSGEAGLKYLVTGAVGSAFAVFGIGLWYAAFGGLALAPAGPGRPGPPDILLALAAVSFILSGIGFKISMAPFHLWTPDVYEGAPAPVTAFLATGSKIAVFAFLMRFCLAMDPDLWTRVQPVFWAAAVLTLVTGTLAALVQTRLKRLLAYSSIAQMGYLIMTLLAVKTESGRFALAFYLVVYAAMDMGAFGIVAMLSPEKTDRDSLTDYHGLGFACPWQGAILSICLLSLAGLPPTAGFVGKILLFKAVLQVNVVALAVIAAAMAACSLFFYMKVVVALYMQPGPVVATPAKTSFFAGLGAGLVLVFLLWQGIVPASLQGLIMKIAAF